MATSSSSMIFDVATALSAAASGGLPVTPCMSRCRFRLLVNRTVALSRMANTAVSECGYADFGMRESRSVARTSPLSSSAKAGDPVFQSVSDEPKAAAYWVPAFPDDDGNRMRSKRQQRCRRGVEPQLVALIEMRAHLAAHPRVIVVEPAQFVGVSMLRSIRRRSIGASVSVSNPFIGFSAPAMSAATTSSRFSIRMPKASVL